MGTEPSTLLSRSTRYLVISVDYEIFGNGTGDVRQHMVHPAERMAQMCERYGVPLTLFFEAEEYLAFEKYSKALTQDLGYDPAQLIREQVASLCRQGHDVQLHLHPEWHGARYEDGRWILQAYHRTVDQLFQSQEEVSGYIGARKTLIEALIGRATPGRRVRAYRAGAFNAQPGRKLLRALAQNGMIIDSSVVKGLQRGSELGGLDYRHAPSTKGAWRVREDVAREDGSGGIWELPIYSVMRRRFSQASFRRLRAKFSSHVPKSRQKAMVGELGLRGANPLKLAQFLLEPVPIKLDFHNLSRGTLLNWVRSAPESDKGEFNVLVAIGHTKEHIDDREFEAFLKALSTEPILKIVSLDQIADMLAAKADFNSEDVGSWPQKWHTSSIRETQCGRYAPD